MGPSFHFNERPGFRDFAFKQILTVKSAAVYGFNDNFISCLCECTVARMPSSPSH